MTGAWGVRSDAGQWRLYLELLWPPAAPTEEKGGEGRRRAGSRGPPGRRYGSIKGARACGFARLLLMDGDWTKPTLTIDS